MQIQSPCKSATLPVQSRMLDHLRRALDPFQLNASDAPSREYNESESKLFTHLLETAPFGTSQTELPAGDGPEAMRCAHADVDAGAGGRACAA